MTTGISVDIDGWYRGYSMTDWTVQKNCLEIAIEKSVDIDDGNPGEEIVFTIDYTIGSGTNTSGTVSIFDIWPEGLTFVSSTPSETETTYSGEFAYEWIITPIPGTA